MDKATGSAKTIRLTGFQWTYRPGLVVRIEPSGPSDDVGNWKKHHLDGSYGRKPAA